MMLLTFLYNCLSDRRKCKFKDLIMFYINNEFHASDYTHYSILLKLICCRSKNDGVSHTPGRCLSDIKWIFLYNEIFYTPLLIY